MKQTREKGDELFKQGDVILFDFEYKAYYHFKVLQKNGIDKADVYLKIDPQGNKQWSCAAHNKETETKKAWGCSMFKGDQSKPFCSHTYAAALHFNTMKEGQSEEKPREDNLHKSASNV